MPIILAIIIILLDQLSKILYVNVFHAPNVTLIKGVFNLVYVENKGAAWGMFAGNQIWLYIFSGILITAMIVFYFIYNKKLDKLFNYSLMIIIAGAVGNMIDRIALGYVRDMIEFGFVEFPVFNIADSAITIGAILLIIDCLFLDGKKLFEDKPKENPQEEQTHGN